MLKEPRLKTQQSVPAYASWLLNVGEVGRVDHAFSSMAYFSARTCLSDLFYD